jgi:hypothetical protein
MAQTKAHADASNRYNKKAYDRLHVSLRKDAELNGEYVRAYAQARGESTNAFIVRAIREAIQRDEH